MPGLKSILTRQAAVPFNFEASLPGIPKLSGVLTQLASAIPIDPQLPEIPVMGEAMAPFGQGITQVIKGVEDALPVGIPKISEGIQSFTMGGYRPVETEEKKPANNKRVMGSGYRSI